MQPIGFSTGALAYGDFRRALGFLESSGATAVELSALRLGELPSLLSALPSLKLARYEYISVHAPAGFGDDRSLVHELRPVWDRGWHVVIHPNDIRDFAPWRDYRALVCVENMDSRKSIGRTAEELAIVFGELPEASLCFDTGHVKHVDPTLTEAMKILCAFGDRIAQLHVSEVDSNGGHHRMTLSSRVSLHNMRAYLGDTVPVIIESPVSQSEIDDEIDTVRNTLSTSNMTQAWAC